MKKWWPTALCVAAIIYATLSDDPTAGADLPPIPYLDKWIHAFMFGGLAGAAAFDWQRAHRAANVAGATMAVICAVCLAFGALDEVAQSLLTVTRSGEWLDLCADALGVGVAFFAAPPAVRRVLKIHKNGVG